jgi:hypothetical protein
VALCRTYLDATGRVLHHNMDKDCSWRQTTGAGGGWWKPPCASSLVTVLPGCGASASGRRLPRRLTRQWLREHLRLSTPDTWYSRTPSSPAPELVDLFAPDDRGQRYVGSRRLCAADERAVRAGCRAPAQLPGIQSAIPEAGRMSRSWAAAGRRPTLTIAWPLSTIYPQCPHHVDRKAEIAEI